MAYRTGANAPIYTPGGVAGGGGSAPVAPKVYPVGRYPSRPMWGDEEDPDETGLGAGSTAQPMPGAWQPGASMEPAKIDPFSDVNYQSLVSSLQLGEQEARNDAAFQTGQVDNELTQALANLQRQYTAQRGNLTTDTRVRGAYDSSQRAALTGRLYEGEQRDSTGARSGAAGRKSSIQSALARLAADYAAQKSRGALDAAGRLQSAEDARLARDQQRMYADQMSTAMAQQQRELLAAIAALMGEAPTGGGAVAGSGLGVGGPRPGSATTAAGGGGAVVGGIAPNNAFRTSWR